jgi:hypothetical protein
MVQAWNILARCSQFYLVQKTWVSSVLCVSLFQWDRKVSQLVTGDRRHGMRNWTDGQKDASRICIQSSSHGKHRMIGSSAHDFQQYSNAYARFHSARWDGTGIAMGSPLLKVRWTRSCHVFSTNWWLGLGKKWSSLFQSCVSELQYCINIYYYNI